jgi:hypothetical protein
MKARAVRSFAGRYGRIRAGMIFECEPGYFQALKRNGLVEKADENQPAQAPDPSPPANRSKPAAPMKAGNAEPDGQGKPPGATDPRKGAGRTITSRSLRQDLRSRGTTSKSSDAGAPAKESTPGDPPPAE